MFTGAVAVAVGLAFAAVPGSAQTDHQHQHGQGQGSPGIPNMMMHEMMGFELPGPRYMIGMRDELNLSEEQVVKLESLASRASQAVEDHMKQALADRARATELLSRNVGFDEYGEALRSAATHMAEAHIAMARSGFEAQNLLTPEQKEVVSVPPTGIHGMHET